jgi:adenosylhomocysteine nucleosidase
VIGVDALVAVAMADEAAPFLDAADVVGPPADVGGAVQHLLSIAGKTVLLVRSGIGLVNAAAAVSSVLATTRPRALISAGTAGGLGMQVRVGDVVVADETLHSAADATGFGYALGQVPGMPERYTCDPALVKAAVAAGTPDIVTRQGLVVSSDSFVTASIVEDVRGTFPEALSTDMESAALAQVAHLFGVPFVSVRAISDLCGPTAGVDHTVRVDDASQRSATVALGLLRGLG